MRRSLVRAVAFLGIAVGGMILGMSSASATAGDGLLASAGSASGSVTTVAEHEVEGAAAVAALPALPVPGGIEDALASGGDTVLAAPGAEGAVSLLRASVGEAVTALVSLLFLSLVVFRGRTQERSKPHSLACFEVPVSPA